MGTVSMCEGTGSMCDGTCVVRHSHQPFDSMADCVPPIKDRAETAFFWVERHDFGLDCHGATHDFVEHVVLAALDHLNPLLADLKEGSIPNGSRFDDFGNTCLELPLRPLWVAPAEPVQEAHVHEDYCRLVKCPDEVFAVVSVHSRFAADRCVHHGQEGCGQLDKGHTPHEGGRDVARQVADDAAAKCDAARVPVHLVLEHKILDLLLDAAVFGGLSRRKDHVEERLARGLELGEELLAVEREHILVGDEHVNVRGHAPHELLTQRAIQRVVEAHHRGVANGDFVWNTRHCAGCQRLALTTREAASCSAEGDVLRIRSCAKKTRGGVSTISACSGARHAQSALSQQSGLVVVLTL